jgi:outer membrane protein OmpA-like peptidoglycan-associated protein
MIRPRLLLLCLGLAIAHPAAAQIMGRPFEFSGQAGFNHYDLRSHVKDGPGYEGSLGWRAKPWLVLEGQILFAPSQADTAPGQDHNLFSAGLDLRMNLRPAESRVVPFVLVGAGYAASATTGHPPDELERGSASMGLGMLHGILNERTFVRFQVRDFFFRERDALEFSQHFMVSLGLHYVWGGRSRDVDLDGVRDALDTCPSTPIGAKVDAHGCPLDTDGDKVFDGLDKCEGTPAGCTVDKNGCPADADGDGVCDGVDTCPDTPKGSTVNGTGCPSDPDGDGVMDGIDQCAGTEKGCSVDAKGCPSDSDKDGVCDGKDQCANTPEGLRVDAAGCPIEVSEKEVELLDTGMIRLQNINFDTGKATIKPESFPVLGEVAKILQQYPTLQIEIGGHTDNRGSAALNEKLSGDRAQAVLDYVKQNFPQIASSQFTSKGYGPTRPIAPNSSNLGRAKNRRVEFKVLNTSALRIERERRSFLRKGGTPPAPAPADTTRRVTPAPPVVPAPADTTRKTEPTPAPPDTSRGVRLTPAPADTTRTIEPIPAPADSMLPPAPAPPDTSRGLKPTPAPPDTTRR